MVRSPSLSNTKSLATLCAYVSPTGASIWSQNAVNRTGQGRTSPGSGEPRARPQEEGWTLGRKVRLVPCVVIDFVGINGGEGARRDLMVRRPTRAPAWGPAVAGIARDGGGWHGRACGAERGCPVPATGNAGGLGRWRWPRSSSASWRWPGRRPPGWPSRPTASSRRPWSRTAGRRIPAAGRRLRQFIAERPDGHGPVLCHAAPGRSVRAFSLPGTSWPGSAAAQQEAGNGWRQPDRRLPESEQLLTAGLSQQYVFLTQQDWQAGVRTVVCEVSRQAGR